MVLAEAQIPTTTELDLNEYRDIINDSPLKENKCEYTEIENVINCMPRDITKSPHCVKTLHLNIHSLPDKIDKLKILLARLKDCNISLDVILLCETFINERNTNLFEIPGYNFISKHRKNLKGGGVAIYIRETIKYKNRDDISIFQEGEFESVFIEAEIFGREIIIGEVYRTPNTPEKISVERYETILDKLRGTKKNVIIGTDQNFDYLKLDIHSNTQDLLNKFVSTGLLPTINKPTRITHTSATLIDNLYIKNSPKDDTNSCILLTDISDHYPIIMFNKYPNTNNSFKQNLSFQYRSLNENTYQRINEFLHLYDWEDLKNRDIDEAHTLLKETIQQAIDLHAPQKIAKIPPKRIIREAWVTKGIMKSSCNLDRLYAKKKKCPLDQDAHDNYTTYRNLFNRIKRKAKELYYTDLIETYKGDIKNTWKILRPLIGKHKDKSQLPSAFQVNGNIVTEPTEIANKF